MNKRITKLILTIFIFFAFCFKINAASASISISSSTSKIVVGNTFSVTIKISSSSPLGSWEFTPSFDSSMIQMKSGDSYVVGYAEDGNTKSKSYTYKFKALKTGNASINVKSYGAYAWDETKLSISAGSKSISIITQKELEASYSKNNNLKDLYIEDLTLSPEFDKDVTSYTAEAEANTTEINIKASLADSKSSISGTGEHEVSEGENKFDITVTAQNGSTKTYTIIVNVIDPDPIKVTINKEEYTIVKRESLLESPENFEPIKITIKDKEIPALYNKTNNFTLVGLKNKESEIVLFLYDKEKNTYTEYNEVTFTQIKIFPLEIDKNFDEGYEEKETIINDVKFNSLKMIGSAYSIIHGKDISSGEDNYYIYDSKYNTVLKYTDDFTKPLKDKIKKQNILIIILGAETILVIIVLICILISKMKKKKNTNLIENKQIKEKRKHKDEINFDEEETKNEILEEKEEIIEEEQDKEEKPKKQTNKKTNTTQRRKKQVK